MVTRNHGFVSLKCHSLSHSQISLITTTASDAVTAFTTKTKIYFSQSKISTNQSNMETTQGFNMSLKKRLNANFKDEILELSNRAEKLGLLVDFQLEKMDGPVHDAIFTYSLKVGDFTGTGQGPSKKEAKTKAAQQVLVGLRTLPLPMGRNTNRKKRSKTKYSGLWKETPEFSPGQNPITCLCDLVIIMRGNPPEFTWFGQIPEIEVYRFKVTVAGESMVGTGHTPREAKRNAAAQMLNSFGYNFPVTHVLQDIQKETPSTASLNNAPDETQEDSQQITPSTESAPSPSSTGNSLEDTSEAGPEVTQRDTAEVTQRDTAEVTQRDTAEVMDVTPSVTEDNAAHGSQVTSEIIHSSDTSQVVPCDVSQEEEEITSEDLQLMSPELLPLLSFMGLTDGKIETVQAQTSENDKECEVIDPKDLDTTQTSILTIVSSPVPCESAAPAGQTMVQSPKVDLQRLQWMKPETLRWLVDMEIVTDVDGTLEWCQLNPIERYQEEAVESQTSTQPENTTATIQSDVPVETVPNTSTQPIINQSNTTDQEETPGEPEPPASEASTSPVLHFGPSVSSTLTRALVRKMFRNAGARRRKEYDPIVNRLEEKTKDTLIVGDDTDISYEKLRKIGKAAAKPLATEYGSPSKLLEAARRPDDEAFEEAVVKHLNLQLVSFKNRPKSALSQFFSRFFARVRRAFTTSS